MTPRAPMLGWFGAASVAALLTGATALAITALPPPPVMLDLGQLPPAAPAIAAIAETAPKVVDTAPALDTPPPAKAEAPAAPPVSLPKPRVLPQSDIAIPNQAPPSKPQTQAKVETPENRPNAKPTKTRAKDKAVASSAPKKGKKAKGGAAKVSPAAYAKAVMKKVRATKRKPGAGKGVAVVGFTVAKNGGLAKVKLIQSSGNAALDQIAVNHIKRSAPFPAPPEGAGQSFSFEFVGK